MLIILGSIYILLAVMGILMLVALASETCPPAGCELDYGGILAIVAFLMYTGAGISTFYLNRTRRGQRASATADEK